MVQDLTDDEVRTLGEDGVVVRDDALALDVLDRIRAAVVALDEADALHPAGIGRDGRLQPRVRSDRITWLEDAGGTDAFVTLFGFFEALRGVLIQGTWQSLPRFSVQLASYRGGGVGYARHIDALPGDPNRRFTAILYLNPGWQPADGGLLRAWTGAGTVELAPVAGRLVLFRSEGVPHQVLPAVAPRYAATAWFRGPEPLPLLPDPQAVRRGLG
ncbi:MAG: 2OG-Fe(II) oxygenase [Alphaproteobacteria bacterium]|nr:2OG-Fe(II) oxygenase [Alphaproteobacteria bacterium]